MTNKKDIMGDVPITKNEVLTDEQEAVIYCEAVLRCISIAQKMKQESNEEAEKQDSKGAINISKLYEFRALGFAHLEERLFLLITTKQQPNEV